MSTDVQPSSSLALEARFQKRRNSFKALFNRGHSTNVPSVEKPLPPAPSRRHTRASSLVEFFSKLDPKNRPEKGGTLREGIDWQEGSDKLATHILANSIAHPSTRIPAPESPVKRIKRKPVPQKVVQDEEIQARKARRELRRSFRESDDFLGIQGINPRTGRRDISVSISMSGETTTTNHSSISENMRLYLEKGIRELNEMKRAYKVAEAKFNAQWERYKALRLEKKEKEKKKRDRDKAKQRGKREAKWQLSETGWNTVFSPDLTPALGSPGGGMREEREDYFSGGMSPISESPTGERGELHGRVRREFVRASGTRHRRHRRSYK